MHEAGIFFLTATPSGTSHTCSETGRGKWSILFQTGEVEAGIVLYRKPCMRARSSYPYSLHHPTTYPVDLFWYFLITIFYDAAFSSTSNPRSHPKDSSLYSSPAPLHPHSRPMDFLPPQLTRTPTRSIPGSEPITAEDGAEVYMSRLQPAVLSFVVRYGLHSPKPRT